MQTQFLSYQRLKLCICSVSFEEKNMTVLLRKPCLDISMWAGCDPNDGQKNLDYYKTWQERFVVTPNNGNATMNDTYNKYQACLLLTAFVACFGLPYLVLYCLKMVSLMYYCF